MNNSTLINVVIVILSLFVLGGMFWVNARLPEVIERVDTVEKVEFKWKETIVRDTVLQPKYIKVLKRDTVYKKDSSEVILERCQETYQKSIVSDKDTAYLTLYVSGIETSLDSLKMRFKTHTEIRTVEVTKYIEKPKTFLDRIHIQPQVTSGYDLINHQWGITAGIGFGIDL